MSPPNHGSVKYLSMVSSGPRGSFEYLLEYDGVRYYLYLEYNEDVPDCVENQYLQRVDDAGELDDDEASCDKAFDCADLFWDFIEQSHRSQQQTRRESHSVKDKDTDICNTSVVKMQVKTVNGVLKTMPHDRHMKYPPTEPVENPCPDLTVFSKSDIEQVGTIVYEIQRVLIHGTEYCVKTVHRRTEECFLAELEKLSDMPSHPNLISLVGVVDAGNGLIDGIVLPYISGKCLQDVSVVTETQRAKWKREIEDAVKFLHNRGMVWGDAKPANIMIDSRRNDRAILIDFGGGTTKGWVDYELSGTVPGDLQGVARINEFIDSIDRLKG